MSSLKLYEGYLDKKGKLNKSWKQRYFMLYNDGRLAYYEPVNDVHKAKKQLGFIDLSVATGLSTHKYDNTDMLYVIERVAPHIDSTYSHEDGFHRRKPQRRPCGKQCIEYIMKIYTAKRIWHLRCQQQQALDEWSTSIKQVIYGNILYESYLLIEKQNARWCLLTNKYELRIYEDETQSKLKQSLDIEQLNMIRYNDRKEAIAQNYKMILIWGDKQFTIAASSRRTRDIWIEKFSQLMTAQLHTLNILMEGYLLVYKQGNDALSNRKYCVMDSNYHIYFSRDIYTFRRFSQCLYFDIDSFEEEKQNVIDAQLSLTRNKFAFKYGKVVNERMLQLFVVMIQESNPHVFYIQNEDLIHFVAPSEMELNAWLHSLTQFHQRYCRSTTLDIMNGMKMSINIPPSAHEPYANAATISKQKMAQKEHNDEDNDDEEEEDLSDVTEDNMMDIAAKKEKYWNRTWKKLIKHIATKESKQKNGMETECNSITECPYFQRIAYLMHFYDDWCCFKRKINAIMRESRSRFVSTSISTRTPSITPRTPCTPSIHETPKQTHFRFKSYAHDSDDEEEHDMKQGDGVYDYLNHSFTGYSTTKLLDDYYHIYLHHKSNDDDFNAMYSQLPLTTNAGYNRKCKVTMCDMLKRNERAKGADAFRHRALRKMYFGYKDVQQVTCIQLLDRIHSLLYHSFDLFRLSENEQKQIQQNNNYYDEDEDKPFELIDYDSFVRRMSNETARAQNEYIDHRFSAMHRIMKTKQKTLISIRRSFDIHCNKFVTQIPNDDIDRKSNAKQDNAEHVRCKTAMNNTLDIKAPLHIKRSQSALTGAADEYGLNQILALDTAVGSINTGSLSHKQRMNEFGICFTYWKQNRSDVDKIYLPPKYANLKQEILCNKLCNISRKDWDHTFCNAHNILLSSYGKQLVADLTESQVKKYKIKDGSAIAINHLQSLLLYCNYSDTLHKYLTYSYHEFDAKHHFKRLSWKDIIQRHSGFVNWAKFLNECVLIFGSYFVESSEFYHGMTAKYKFNDFRIYFNYPISVTTKCNIAAAFVDKEGVVLRFNRCEIMSGSKLIDCAFLSDTQYEEEVLLLFADKRPLKITSIIEMNTSYSYYYHLCAINILDDIINGRSVDESHLNNTATLKRLHELLQYKFDTETYQIQTACSIDADDQCVDNVIMPWLSPTFGAKSVPRYVGFAHKMDYIHKLFISYCNHQNNLIKFDVNLIRTNPSLNKYVASYFVESVDCLKMDSLIKLFPNSKAFEIKCPVLHSFVFDSMIELLQDELIQNMNAQIQRITFKWLNCIQQDCNMEDIVTAYAQKFKAFSWIIQKTTKYGFDYLTIKIQE